MKKTQSKTNFGSNKNGMEILKNVYRYRCLNLEQLHKIIYDSWEVDRRQLKRLVGELDSFLDKGVLISKEHRQGEVFFLTAKGIYLIRTCDTSGKVLDGGNPTLDDYRMASELDVSPEFLNQQITLNDFVVKFALDRGNVSMDYCNEKHIDDFLFTKPNGILSFLQNHFFLEMDWSTKGEDLLCEKKENYLRILGSPEFKNLDYKMIVLLIIQDNENTQERIDHIKNVFIKPLTDHVGERFGIYAGTRWELYEVLNRIISLSKGKN